MENFGQKDVLHHKNTKNSSTFAESLELHYIQQYIQNFWTNAEILISFENCFLFSSLTILFQATHINFICPMRFDAFPLDTQVTIILVEALDSFRQL